MQYYQRNDEALAHEKSVVDKQVSEWGNNASMLYLQPGSTVIRVLPPYSEAGVFFHKIMKHNIRIEKRNEAFVCPESLGQPCPVCDKGRELVESRDDFKMKFAGENLRPKPRYLYNVLCYTGPADKMGAVPEVGKVYVMESGITVHKSIISLDQDAATGWADLTNPETGFMLVVNRSGKGLDTRYTVNPHGNGRTNLFEDCVARNINPNSLKLFNLEEVYSMPPEEKLAEVVNSIDSLVSGAFGAAPMPRPVPQPAMSPGVAAVTPSAPPVAPPAPAAAPVVPPVMPGPAVQPTTTEQVGAHQVVQPMAPPVVPPPPSMTEKK